jgi:hypothetical protein
MEDQDKHWLVRARTIRLLWIVQIVVLALTVLAQFVMPVKGHFEFDGSFGFNAWFGFLACAAMILFAKLLGMFLKRNDTYYDHDE